MICDQLSKKFIFLLFIVVLSSTAYAQQGVIMTIKITCKYPDPLTDTAMKVWSKENLIKTVFFPPSQVIFSTHGGDSSFKLDTIIKGQGTTDQADLHLRYIRNAKTGESLDILPGKERDVTWKRVERNHMIWIDSTKKIFLNEEKIIAGHTCKKVILENRYTKKRDTIYAATDIKGIKNPYFPYLKLFPMIFTDHDNMFEVTELAFAPLDDKIFDIPANSIIVSDQKEWIKYLGLHRKSMISN